MRPARRVPRGGATVAVATAVANVLAYALSLVLSRQLGPVGFGQVAPLLAVVLVATATVAPPRGTRRAGRTGPRYGPSRARRAATLDRTRARSRRSLQWSA